MCFQWEHMYCSPFANLFYLLNYNISAVLCEVNGIMCSGKGSCGPGVVGCICDAEDMIGEYCESIDEHYSSGAFRQVRWITLIITISTTNFITRAD